MINYITFNDEIMPGKRVSSLENIEIKKGMKGFIYKDRVILFGQRISLYDLKNEYYYDSRFTNFINTLENNNVEYVCKYDNGLYESMNEFTSTYEEVKKEIKDNLDYKKIDNFNDKTDDEITLLNINDSKFNKTVIPFVLFLIKKMNNGLNEKDVIDCLSCIGISDALIIEIISLINLYTNNETELLSTFNSLYYTDLDKDKDSLVLTKK